MVSWGNHLHQMTNIPDMSELPSTSGVPSRLRLEAAAEEAAAAAAAAEAEAPSPKRSRTQESQRITSDHVFRSPVPGRSHTPYPQDRGPPDLEPGNLPPHLSDLYNTFMQMLTDVIAEELIPDEWISDIWAFVKAPAEIRRAVLHTLGIPEEERPDQPTGLIAPFLKRDKAEITKLSRKITSKKTVIRNLEEFKAKGDIPPTLRIPLPKSISDCKDFERATVPSYVRLLEMIKACEDQALQATLDTRIADLDQLEISFTEITNFVLRSNHILKAIAGNISDVPGEEFEVIKPLLRTAIRTHLSIYWNSHTKQAFEEVRARQVLELLSKGKEMAKREQNLTNRNLHFESNMDTSPEDPAATPATKADVDRLSSLLLSQRNTIAAQEKLIKSLNTGKHTSKTPQKPRSPAVTADKAVRGRSTTRKPTSGSKGQNVTQNRSKSNKRTQNRSGPSRPLTTKKSSTGKIDTPPTHNSTSAVRGRGKAGKPGFANSRKTRRA
jgi:hypothetical protein